MKSIIILLSFFLFRQTSFIQNIDDELISKKFEINLSLEPNMRGIRNKKTIYFIEKDMQTLSAYEKGKLKWKTNIIAVCGEPKVGKSEIRFLKFNEKTRTISVVFGKHSFAEVEIRNGNTKFLGAD
ncbi:MAG: hypothetical protein H7250_00310 [Flavobacterium sp.]|nr:hypothetical protein [Flavobacterium sp.]